MSSHAAPQTTASEPADGSSVGSWLERMDDAFESLSRYVNPILIKEARQALKSRQFVFSFALLLIAAWSWSLGGVLLMNPAIYFLPTGPSMLLGYYFVLAVPLLAVVPLAAHRSLASEIDDGTFELLSVTALGPLQIVTGKLASAGLQMMVYFSALVPCLAFTYLLRGIDLPTIVFIFAIVFTVASLLTVAGLFLATLASGRAGQIFMLLCVVVLVGIGELACGGFVVAYLSSPFSLAEVDAAVAIGGLLVGALSFIVLGILAASSAIAPVSENRSTKLRIVMFIQQLLWVGAWSYPIVVYREEEVAFIAIFGLAIYWGVMGTLMLGESPILSPRVRRTLPQSFFGRMFLTWFNPGSGTGFVFASIQAVVGIGAIAMLSTVAGDPVMAGEVWEIAAILTGYLLFFLGLTRLIVQLLSLKLRMTFGTAAAVQGLVMSLAAVVPYAIISAVNRRRYFTYDLSQVTNWAWTIEEWVDSGLPWGTPFWVFAMGALCAALNVMTLGGEVLTRRVQKPKRVEQDEAVPQPTEVSFDTLS